MKKFLIVVLIVVMALVLMACGKSAAEKMAEEMMENVAAESGEDVDVDIDGDGESGSITVSDGENEMVIESDEDGMAWPGDKLPGSVPELSGVKIVAVQAMDMMVSIYFEGCDESTGQAYIAAMKANGWDIITEIDMEDAHQVQAQIGEEWLHFTWTEDDGSGGVVYSKDE